MGTWFHPSTGGTTHNLYRWSWQVLPPLCGIFQLSSHEFLIGSWFPGIWDFLIATPSSPFPIATYLSSISWPSVHLHHLIPYLSLTPFPLPLSHFSSSQVSPILYFLPLIILFPLLGRKHPLFPSSWASCGLWVVSWVFHALCLISTYQWVHSLCSL